jgi:hypothetical protein
MSAPKGRLGTFVPADRESKSVTNVRVGACASCEARGVSGPVPRAPSLEYSYSVVMARRMSTRDARIVGNIAATTPKTPAATA